MNYYRKNRIHDDITRHFLFLKDGTHRDFLHLFPCKGKYHSVIETILATCYLGHIKKEHWLNPLYFLYDFGYIPDYQKILQDGKVDNKNEAILRYINNVVYSFGIEHIIRSEKGKNYAIDLFVELNRLDGDKKLGLIFETKPHYSWNDKYKSDTIRQLKLYESCIKDKYADVYKFIVSNLNMPTDETDVILLTTERIGWLTVDPKQKVDSTASIVMTKELEKTSMYHPKQEIIGNIYDDMEQAKNNIIKAFITFAFEEKIELFRPEKISQLYVKSDVIKIEYDDNEVGDVPVYQFMKYLEERQKLLEETKKKEQEYNKLKGTLKLKRKRLNRLKNRDKKKNRRPMRRR